MRGQLGFSLIEILISLVVISIGLLGMAALQTTSLQQNQSAFMRSQATLLAYDIVDRIRANDGQVATGAYFVASGSNKSNCENYTGAVSDTSACTPANMAAYDLYTWMQSLAADLPDGGGRVCRSDLKDDDLKTPDCEGATSDNPVVVYVWWTDERGSSTVTQVAISTEI